MGKSKTNEISTTYSRENLKVTCIERRYRVEDSKVSFIVNAKKELDEDTTSKLLHEDMELKTFLANYEITEITPHPEEIENTETVRENLSAKNSLKTVIKHKARIGKTHTIEDIMRKEPKSSFENESKDEMDNLSRDTTKGTIRYTTKGIRTSVKNVSNDEISKDIKENISKDIVENEKKSPSKNLHDEVKKVSKIQERNLGVWERRQLFDTIVLPEKFRARDYKEAIEEKGIKITNEAMPYDDLNWLEEQGKIVRIDKEKRGQRFYKLVKKNEQENNTEEIANTIVQ